MRLLFSLLSTAIFVSLLAAQTAPKQSTPPAPKPSTVTAPATQPAAGATKSGAQSPTSTAPPPTASSVDPNATVITIPGLCEAGQADCKNTITRAEFEKLINALNPNLPTAQRRRIAELYAQLLALSNEGRKLGAENDPALQERMRLQRMQLLAQEAEKKIQEQSKPSPAEVEAFYKENGSRFEQIALRRITIPKNTSPSASAKAGAAKTADKATAKPTDNKALAEKIQQRAAAGEDPDKLQAEVWLATKAAGAPPSTSQGMKRRGMMDPRHETQILQLKAGEVSPVIEDGQSFYIYKVDSKQQIPLSEAEKDISTFLQQQKFQQRMQQIISSVKPTLNDAYFGPPSEAEEQGQPKLPQRPEAGEPK